MNTIKAFYAKYRATGATTEEFAQFLVSIVKNDKVEALVKDWIKTDQSSQQILRSQSVKELLNIH